MGLNMLMLRIIHRRDGMYDVYNGMFGQQLCSYGSADEVFLKLADYGPMQIEFVDGCLNDIHKLFCKTGTTF